MCQEDASYHFPVRLNWFQSGSSVEKVCCENGLHDYFFFFSKGGTFVILTKSIQLIIKTVCVVFHSSYSCLISTPKGFRLSWISSPKGRGVGCFCYSTVCKLLMCRCERAGPNQMKKTWSQIKRRRKKKCVLLHLN